MGVLCLAVGFVTAIQADQEQRKAAAPKEAVVTGRVVDLQCFMTGTFPSGDEAKCSRDCIKAGVPAALETEDGLMLIGQGIKGPRKTISKFALKNVEIKGTIYERHGVHYIDMSTVRELDEVDAAKDSDDSDETDETDGLGEPVDLRESDD